MNVFVVREHFAWFPKRVLHRWVWLRKYWSVCKTNGKLFSTYSLHLKEEKALIVRAEMDDALLSMKELTEKMFYGPSLSRRMFKTNRIPEEM